MKKFSSIGEGEIGYMAPVDSSQGGERGDQVAVDRENARAMWDTFSTLIQLIVDRTTSILDGETTKLQDRKGWVAQFQGARKKIFDLFRDLSLPRYKKHLKDPDALERKMEIYQTEVAPNFDRVLQIVQTLPVVSSDRLSNKGTTMRGSKGGRRHR